MGSSSLRPLCRASIVHLKHLKHGWPSLQKYALRPHPGSYDTQTPYNGLTLACTRDHEAVSFRCPLGSLCLSGWVGNVQGCRWSHETLGGFKRGLQSHSGPRHFWWNKRLHVRLQDGSIRLHTDVIFYVAQRTKNSGCPDKSEIWTPLCVYNKSQRSGSFGTFISLSVHNRCLDLLD